MTKNLERCLKLAETMPLNEAVKASNITEAEADKLVDIMIDKLGREKWGDDAPKRSQRGIKDIVARLDDMEGRIERVLTNLIEHIAQQRETVKQFAEALDQYIDLTHPGRPANNRQACPGQRSGDAGATKADLALVTQKVRQLRPRGISGDDRQDAGPTTDGDCPKAG